MNEKIVLRRGAVVSVTYRQSGSAQLELVDGRDDALYVRHSEADTAREAMKAVPPREVEVISGNGDWQSRTVRFAPVVEVKARGTVCTIYDGIAGECGSVTLVSSGNYRVANVMDALLRAEVEIVSIDGGPDMVRRVS